MGGEPTRVSVKVERPMVVVPWRNTNTPTNCLEKTIFFKKRKKKRRKKQQDIFILQSKTQRHTHNTNILFHTLAH